MVTNDKMDPSAMLERKLAMPEPVKTVRPTVAQMQEAQRLLLLALQQRDVARREAERWHQLANGHRLLLLSVAQHWAAFLLPRWLNHAINDHLK